MQRMRNDVEADGFSSKMISREPEIIAHSTALIVVDMVNAYLDPHGAMPVSDPEDTVQSAVRAVSMSRDAGCRLIWVRPGHTEHDDGLFRKRIPHAIGEDADGDFFAPLIPEIDEKVIRKRRYSAFFSTDLDMYLREHHIQTVVLIGVALNICVRSTAQDAFFLGYDVVVAEDACRATGDRERDSTLYDIATHFGSVLDTDDLRGLLVGEDTTVRP